MTSTTPSSSSSFRQKLERRIDAVNSLLCVGLDPHARELFPDDTNALVRTDAEQCAAALTFCQTLVYATAPYTCCYKPNAAFFEALGEGGMETLRRVVTDVIPSDIPVLLDVKRGDIGSTAGAYASACYEFTKADAVTLSPLMGWDSVSPFVSGSYSSKGAFLLCKTSNPGSNEFLNAKLSTGEFLFESIAKRVGSEWSKRAPEALMGLVVGATDTDALSKARQAAGNGVWILAPGVGAQGGDLLAAARAGMNSEGSGLLIPVSRGISKAADPAVAAKELCEQIQSVREQVINHNKQSNLDESISVKPHQKEFIEFSLAQGVLKFGSFELKSGRLSPYFFNAGLFSTGQSLFLLGKAYASSIMASPKLTDGHGGVVFDVIFGPAYKGISLGAIVSSALYSDFGVTVGFTYNRKEAKDHGEGGKLVGASMKGKRVLVVDDVITAGTAIRESHEMLTEIGAIPIGVVIALDRAEIRSLNDKISAVQAVARDLSLEVASIVNLKELQIFLESSPLYDEKTLLSVKEYRDRYGAD